MANHSHHSTSAAEDSIMTGGADGWSDNTTFSEAVYLQTHLGARYAHLGAKHLGPDLQNILRQSYDYLTIMPKLLSTYAGRLIYKTSHEGRKAFLRYDSLAKL